ncbi:MAG TPA: UDP-N-acetylmuramoyl-L-alanyl-D-glutamate--2,6-diaminopimelate ligase, partial [Gemmatimonadales bacterium]|nr:UDP-N-acetylmuramoyl-L-alanyl-D-glutamate--2,6-diaminopimelate ligase [Gemmatimonadales bacterium]
MTDLAGIVAALRAAGQLVAAPDVTPALTGITADSRRVRPGMLFCAVEGSQADGHRFLQDAVTRGAGAVLVTRPAGLAVPEVVVHDGRLGTAVSAAAWYGHPAARLRLVGVTGTNGKSTTVALIRHLLNAAGDVGALGTLGGFDGAGAPLPDDAGLTTPGPIELQGALAELVRRGARTVVMEASSHALHQRRVAGLAFAAAVFTNLTHDHLDYHGDLEQYLAAKALLSDLLAGDGIEVVNQDDPAWRRLAARPGIRRVSFGLAPEAEVRAEDVVLAPGGSTFRLRLGATAREARLPLLGEFNVSNALGGAAAAWSLGLEPDAVAARLASAPQVAGRMERLAAREWTVLRDYAHTPDALRRALRTLKPITPGRLVVLFGCGGDRDRRKRPVMGGIAAREADVAVVTSDNPRTEDPDRIIDEIEAGMEG